MTHVQSSDRSRSVGLVAAMFLLLVGISLLARFVGSETAQAMQQQSIEPEPTAMPVTAPVPLPGPTPLVIPAPSTPPDRPVDLNNAFLSDGLHTLDEHGLWKQTFRTGSGWEVVPLPRVAHDYGCRTVLNGRIMYVTTDVFGDFHATIFDTRGAKRSVTVTRLPELAAASATKITWCNGTSVDELWLFPVLDDDRLVLMLSDDFGKTFTLQTRAVGR